MESLLDKDDNNDEDDDDDNKRLRLHEHNFTHLLNTLFRTNRYIYRYKGSQK